MPEPAVGRATKVCDACAVRVSVVLDSPIRLNRFRNYSLYGVTRRAKATSLGDLPEDQLCGKSLPRASTSTVGESVLQRFYFATE